MRDGDDLSCAGGEFVRAGDVSLRVGHAFHVLRDVSLLETCVLSSTGGVSIRVGDDPSTVRDECLAVTCASYKKTSRSYDVGGESLGDGRAPSRVGCESTGGGDVSLRVGHAFHALRDVSLLETCVLSSTRAA